MHHDTTGAFVAAASQVLLALFGVDYYAMLWAFVGSLFALGQAKMMTRRRAVAYVALSTLLGAALGTVFVEWAGTTHRAYLIFGSLLGGSGSQLIVPALVAGTINRIRTTLGGAQNEPADTTH
jgi:hypothetical protein